MARIIVVFGVEISRFYPATYTITFVFCDLFSLLLQAAGGAIASGATDPAKDQMGINIMIAGLSTQIASLAIFMILCGEFAYRAYKNPFQWDPAYTGLRQKLLFKAFVFSGFRPSFHFYVCRSCRITGLGLATITVFVRSCFRVAELRGGFHGPLANQEITFMILEGAMIIIASLCLTVFHPGVAFHGVWHQADFTLRKRSPKVAAGSPTMEDVEKNSMEVGIEAGLAKAP